MLTIHRRGVLCLFFIILMIFLSQHFFCSIKITEPFLTVLSQKSLPLAFAQETDKDTPKVNAGKTGGEKASEVDEKDSSDNKPAKDKPNNKGEHDKEKSEEIKSEEKSDKDKLEAIKKEKREKASHSSNDLDFPLAPSKPDKLQKKITRKLMEKEGAPVIVFGKRLFKLNATLADTPPKKRARLLSGRLENLISSPDTDSDKLESIFDKKRNICRIFYDNRPIFFITPEDAEAYNISIELAGMKVVDLLKFEIEDYHWKMQSKNMHLGMIMGIAGLMIIGLIFYLFGLLANWFARTVNSKKGTLIKSLKVQKAEVLSQDSIGNVLIMTFNVIRYFMIVLILFFYFGSFLSYFPGTAPISAALLKYPIAYLKILMANGIGYIPKLVFIVIALLFTRFVLKLTKQFFNAVGEGKIQIPGFHEEYLDVTHKITRFLIYFFALVLIAPNLPGYASPVFKGLSIFTGIIVSLGSSSSVANILAGVTLAYTREFKVGDIVKIGENTGQVKEMTLLITRLRTPQKTDVSIPNSLVLANQVVNYSSPIPEEGGVILYTTITIGYDVPGDKVRDLCLKAVDSTDNLLKTPEPYVLEKSLDDFYVSYQIHAYTDTPQLMRMTYSQLHKNIRKEFDTAGVEIMSPHFSALRDGNQTTTPEGFLPDNYKAPAFKVETNGRSQDG